MKQLKQLSISELVKRYNLIIPEIQREYVWGLDRNNILSEFFKDVKDSYKEYFEYTKAQKEELKKRRTEIIESDPENIMDQLQKLEEEFNADKIMDIGFLYTYDPPFSSSYHETKDTYLIDGQQRFTTLFLTWLYLSIKFGNINEFKKIVRFSSQANNNEPLAFDYRVRDITKDFLFLLVDKSSTIDDLLTVETKTWFIASYASDPSISGIVSGLKIIHEYCKEMGQDEHKFITELIKFWHFETNNTNQGEELYITMNARGKAISNNENICAKLFELEKDKSKVIEWGKKWEEWQDLFWKNKGENPDADFGFDSFLNCIAGLELYLNEDGYSEREISVRSVVEALGTNPLETIEKYIQGLKFISDKSNIREFTKKYEFTDWVEDCISNVIWSEILNDAPNGTNWFADYQNSSRRKELRRMTFLWSILHFLKNIELSKDNIPTIFRVLRIFYVRYKNTNRALKKGIQHIHSIMKDGVWAFESDIHEENIKHKALVNVKSELTTEIESLIWEIESKRYNLNATDLGSVNSSHLVDYGPNLSVDYLKLVLETYKRIFDGNDKTLKELQILLLYYGDYWEQVTPYYYQNYKFDDWRRTIRKEEFKIFFKEFMRAQKDIEELLKEKEGSVTISFNTESLQERLIWYAEKLGLSIWEKGNYIKITNENYCALHKYGGAQIDKVFDETYVMFSSAQSISKYGVKPLYDLLDKPIQKEVKKEKAIIHNNA